ncbi:protoporphyrinogen oxidase [Planctomycetes bacterium CA13]|uniref:Protoporphyrinogen oxidase n=1 Tax=Novipirellula herctigrandis TaxID=2527986 RepID=A0A5C5Z6M2_9BACT|nr:protoporphyrinogen oxidase [Planctomycetes bacterium CA13]
MRIAIVGTGISGSLVARLLSSLHDVVVYEANHYAGGHANTVDISLDGTTYSVDTGFMVFNERTYPNFCKMLEWLAVPSQPSEMSFSVRCSNSQTEYQGSSLNGLFAQRSNLVRPSFLRLLRDIVRFNRLGMAAAASGCLKDGRSVGDFLNECSVGKRFVQHYLVPMAAAIWSSKPESILSFPAEFMIGFFANHGLMQLRDRPQWRTILGGSRHYLTALLAPLENQLRLNQAVTAVERKTDGVVVTTNDGNREWFDKIVMASHADQTLKLLAHPTDAERKVLGAFSYQLNEAVLHTDSSLLPKRPRTWASWNYHIPKGRSSAASVTYDLSRLQNHASPVPILLTLNETESIDPSKVMRNFSYTHPAFASDSIAAQSQFHSISGHNRTHYCGAYWGYGFHEDGVNSAISVAKHFGIPFQSCTVASTKEPSRIAATSL